MSPMDFLYPQDFQYSERNITCGMFITGLFGSTSKQKRFVRRRTTRNGVQD